MFLLSLSSSFSWKIKERGLSSIITRSGLTSSQHIFDKKKNAGNYAYLSRCCLHSSKDPFKGLSKKGLFGLLISGCMCVGAAFYWAEMLVRSSVIVPHDFLRGPSHDKFDRTGNEGTTKVGFDTYLQTIKRKIKRKVQMYKYRSWKDIDHKTMVKRARMKDFPPKQFPKMILASSLPSTLVDDFRHLISKMQLITMLKEESCLNYHTTKTLKNETHHDERQAIYGAGVGGLGELTFIMSIDQNTDTQEFFEIKCLKLLAAQTALTDVCDKFIELGGLNLLHKTYFLRENSLVVKRTLAKIIGNLALNPKHGKDIINAGWLQPLALWLRSLDIELCLQSARALANLDSAWEPVAYNDGLYLIHPIFKKKQEQFADVVLVHGLLGGPFKTWRQQDRKVVGADKPSDGTESVRKGTYTFCWPKDWLSKDCPEIRILGVEFDTGLFMWGECPLELHKRSLQERANKIIAKLQKADVGSRPIIWIGHSMGGLLIKYILCICESDPKLRHIVRRTKGIVFYSTPHRGSPQVDLYIVKMLRPTVEVQQLSGDSVELKKLHKDFLLMAQKYNYPVLSFGEGLSTPLSNKTGEKLKGLVVPPESSDPGIGTFHLLETNHLNVCKPVDRDSMVYQATLHFIRQCIPEQRHRDNILRTIKSTFLEDDSQPNA